MVLDVPGGEAQAAEVAEAERRCKKELRALAKCQREQAKKGNAADKCFVEYGRALNHCLADKGRLCKAEGANYSSCWSSWMSCGYYRGNMDCDRELSPMLDCLERQLGAVPGGRAPSPRNFMQQ